jgi:3alpha(or 20beta)-hydroxysteroid dehydrogenase
MTKAVLVTGAAGGIGAGLVEALTEAGWAVLGSDHPSADPATSIRKYCQGWIPADLASLSQEPNQLEAFKAAVLSATEGADVMAIVHNAALQRLGSFEQLSASDWRETMAVNLLGKLWKTQSFYAKMSL